MQQLSENREDFLSIITQVIDDGSTGYRHFKNEPTKNSYFIEFYAVPDSIPLFRDYLETLLEVHEIPEKQRYNMMLVADEASTNIVNYAYNDVFECSKKTFACKIVIKNTRYVRILIRDNGFPHGIFQIEKPDMSTYLDSGRVGGFGLYLIHTLADRVLYNRRNDMNYFVAEFHI